MSGNEVARLTARPDWSFEDVATAVRESAGLTSLHARFVHKQTELKFPRTLQEIGVNDGARLTMLAFKPWRLATASDDFTINMWSLSSGECSRFLDGHKAMAFSADGGLVAVAPYDGTVELWDTATCERVHQFMAHRRVVQAAAFSLDGRLLATTRGDGIVKVWEIATGDCLHGHVAGNDDVEGQPLLVPLDLDDLRRLQDPIEQNVQPFPALDPTSRTLRQLIALGEVDRADRAFLLRCEAFGYRDEQAPGAPVPVLSPDGGHLALPRANLAILWSMGIQNEQTQFEGHTSEVGSVSFSPDGRQLATAADDHTARLWQVATGELVHELRGHTRIVTSAVFAPSGHQLSTTSLDTTVILWDTSSGERSCTLRGGTLGLECSAFSPDEVWLAAGAYDGSARVWELASASCLHVLEGHTSMVRCIAFLPYPEDDSGLAAAEAAPAEHQLDG